jgi:hypothetical protein
MSATVRGLFITFTIYGKAKQVGVGKPTNEPA